MEIGFFLIAFTLHNVEEALYLPAWSKESKFQKTVEPDVFLFAVTIVTLTAYMTGILYLLWPASLWMQYLQTGLIGAILVNVIMPHAVATAVERKYSPGLVTGVLLLIPSGSLAIVHIFQSAELRILDIVIATVGAGILLIALILLLFALGERIFKKT
ncbi:Protein of unknown function with HXXEE motif-containing protein [Terribacillus aidingensis]|uniref:HXXEE domain-containing protein n=1 Tax=Terribacillus aidingensis TaxID=586416 RepID=A0A285N8G1_9BACI|nr:HXXEE domain-containing protein [Terribacillus aidingensis]SNZ04256.1 Protein of unknown function with HXXEE motif-containing protein [Terribacillus aidingensis]